MKIGTMTIKKIIENPYHKQTVKNLPADAEYRQQTVDDNEIYYSKVEQCYYVVAEKKSRNTK